MESRTLEAPPSLPQEHLEQPRQSKKTAVKVYIARDRTEELNVEKQNAGSTALAAPKNNHAESKKIAVKVYLVRAETEEIAVEQLKAGNAALTATKDIENKVDVVIAREKYEELDVKKQKADNDDTLHQHHQRQEQEHQRVRQGVIARNRTEEVAVEKQNAGNDAPTAFKNIKNKTDEVVARDKFEELDVQKRNADDDDTQHQHHHHHQEQARRV